jgi:Mrp family chromosome partitioning ATPase
MGTIITFYSYAGGIGRTMAVANAAWILASSGYRVLAIDWDLESPGLHWYFRPFLRDPELVRTLGLADFLSDPPRRRTGPTWFHDCTLTLDTNFSRGSIRFIPAGQQDQHYAERLNELTRADVIRLLGGATGIADLRHSLKEAYDYVLIDGPTGVGKVVDICNARIPDTLVALFAFNHKTIAGTVAEAEKAMLGRSEPRIFPVPARVEYGESEKLNAARRHSREVFASLIAPVLSQTDGKQSAYWNDVEIPYISYYAFEEILPALRDEPGSSRGLTAPHERLLSWITGQTIATQPREGLIHRKLIEAYGFGRAARASSEPRSSLDDRVAPPPAISRARPKMAMPALLWGRWFVRAALILSLLALVALLTWIWLWRGPQYHGWRGDACDTVGPAKLAAGLGRRAGGSGAVALDLGFGQRVEVGKDGRPRTGLAERGDAVVECAFQEQREERAEDVAADRLVELVIDGGVANRCFRDDAAGPAAHGDDLVELADDPDARDR